MASADQPPLKLPDLGGALPADPTQLMRLNRLCLRIYGLLTRDIPAQAAEMVAAAGGSLGKKERQTLIQVLGDELPVIMALHALERLDREEALSRSGLSELLRGLLLPCFSLAYSRLYAEPADPLRQFLDRVDWYLDGDKGQPLEAFAHLASTLLGEHLEDMGPLVKHLSESLLPEMDRRLELAFRYEFGSSPAAD
ncbi:MAG: hypothetical protein V1797_01520 [Pseudomonadota bacterium]